MSHSQSEMKADDFSSRVVFGTVIKVLPYGAVLRLPDMIEVGYLHISQVSSERIDAPLSNTLKVGDTIEVLIKWFDQKHQCWETSHKAIIQRQRWESMGGTTPGTRFRARVLKASEFGAVVDVQGVPGSIFAGIDFWNAYNVLYQAGYLMPNESVEVVVMGWDTVKGRPKLYLYLGDPQTLARGTVCDGKVFLLRRNKVLKHNLYNDIYARLIGGEIAWVHARDIVVVEKTFPLGSTIPLVVQKYSPPAGMFEAKIEWGRTSISAHVKPEVGTVVDAKVIGVRPFGAICLVSDHVQALMHHSTIVQEKSGDTRRHLCPGDVVKAAVVPPTEQETSYRRMPDGKRITVHVEHPKEGGIQLKFLQLVDRTLDTETTESDDLIDLRVTRRAGASSGFQRDQNFRLNVLEAFDHICCVCGARHVFGTASAMEAAHIIPRGRRGADNTRNSLCLCSLHHWAFDRGFLTIDENFRVVVARQIIDLGEPASLLTRYHGNKIHASDPTIISIDAIQWHRENIFFDESN